MIRFRFSATILALIVLGGSARAGTAQSLRGSMASVDRMYDHAVHDGLTFYETTNAVLWAAARGELVQLHSDHGYTMRRVNFPYVRPATLTFVERLADNYERVCDEPLVVTSGVRPESRQPSNSSHRSVHPTGMAVDLHKPTRGRCLTWLRGELLALEGTGVIEATEEHHPAHFHVAVFADEYMRFARIQAEANPTVMIVARTSPPAPAKPTPKHYRVREGDSLWSIAQQHSTSVRELMVANGLRNQTKIKTGQTLVIPAGGRLSVIGDR
jgi:LysM repeat protein